MFTHYTASGGELPISLDSSKADDKQLLELLKCPSDHDGLARSVQIMFPSHFVYTEATGWMYYTGSHWESRDAGGTVRRAIVKTLRFREQIARERLGNTISGKEFKASNSNVEGIMARLRDQVGVCCNIADFDNDPDLLNAQNGVIDLRSGELISHAPNQRFTYCIQVDYDPNAQSKLWDDFILQTVSSPDIARYLQMAAGYSATGCTNEEVLFYLFGPTRSGKGVFTETLLAVLGDHLATGLEFTSFSAPRYGDTQYFDFAPLKSCRFVAAGESNKNVPLNTAKVKQLTGGDRVRCAFKYGNHFAYQPQFKIWLSSNHPFNADVDDDAVWARVRVIQFSKSHEGAEDRKLKQTLREPENLQAVLAWIVKGAYRWYKFGLPELPAITEATQTQRDEQDDVYQFLKELCVDDACGWIAIKTLYIHYDNWCSQLGIPVKEINQFSRAVSSKGYTPGRKRNGGMGQERGFTSLRLRRPEEN